MNPYDPIQCQYCFSYLGVAEEAHVLASKTICMPCFDQKVRDMKEARKRRSALIDSEKGTR